MRRKKRKEVKEDMKKIRKGNLRWREERRRGKRKEDKTQRRPRKI